MGCVTTRFYIRDKRFMVKFPKRIRHQGHDADGLCEKDNKIIRVQRDLRDKRLVEVVVEEVIHAAIWDLDEPCVQETAKAVAEALFNPEIWKRFHDQAAE